MKKLNMVANVALVLAVGFSSTACAATSNMAVKINSDIASVTVKHNGKSVTIKRDQNQKATVIADFAKTSRKCPPFCIQPSTLAPGVETIAEVEVIDYLDRLHNKGDNSILVVDSRTTDWVGKGTIPGSVSIPWTKLNPSKGADPLSMSDIMEGQFGAKQQEGLWNFSNVKTLVLFCNGMWCGQSPNNIKQLLKMGYPAHKIKWYRGGMQNWANLGLTMAK
ncbi:MAG: rhodanese-like domain-containing protein [Gammaproteobacteria bacterium]|nr:rhodanese-like domain-containing protein [Gammaproteobacteria bacterium]MCW8986684.1 rhodanese-like domain-containing protein [Gammaproteobacteria bacterium]MCW9031539.1 rhodanese-like domain-containing protein [Gammaproteobacteria bacterium]